MRSLSNLQVSTKLAVVSFVSITLVVGIIGTQVWGSSAVHVATGNVVRRADLARAMLEAKVGVQSMQTGAFRMRLAQDFQELEEAQTFIRNNSKAALAATDKAISLSSFKTTLAALNGFKKKIAEFNKHAESLAKLDQQLILLRGQDPEGEAAKAELEIKIAVAQAKEVKVARADITPIANEITRPRASLHLPSPEG